MCHVLIIEDEPFVAMHIEALLHDQGATSFAFAASEDEAVASALATRPGLITSDVRLLAGAGPAAVERIRAQIGEVPVIYITSTPEECAAFDAPGIVLGKPVWPDALAQAYNSFMPDAGAPATT